MSQVLCIEKSFVSYGRGLASTDTAVTVLIPIAICTTEEKLEALKKQVEEEGGYCCFKTVSLKDLSTDPKKVTIAMKRKLEKAKKDYS